MNSNNEIEIYKYSLAAASLLGAGALTYFLTKASPRAIKDNTYDLDNQSIEIDEKEHIRVCKSVYGKKLVEYRFEDAKTLYEAIRKGKALSDDGPFLGKREALGKGRYIWTSYSEVLKSVDYVGCALMKKGIVSDNSNRIGIYSSNRNEWIISEHGCYCFSLTVVSLYDSYGKDAIKYILNHAEIQAIFVDSFARLMNLADIVGEVTHLKFIVYFDNLKADELEKLDKIRKTVELIALKDFLELGKNNLVKHNPPKPSDIATICYTSGTTGLPKGALLSHGNLIANEAGLYERFSRPHVGLSREVPRPVLISYLPLAHMLERQASVLMFLTGGRIGFMSSNVQNLFSDIKELQPTDMNLVPRILNRLYNMVNSRMEGSFIKRTLFKRALASKKAEFQRGIFRKNSIYDKLVFDKIRESTFGSRIIRCAIGSAPLSDEVMLFSRAVLGCPLMEGYGQTEATCAVSFQHPLDPTIGHCGPPVVCNMVKLDNVPEMDYFAKDNKGEICIKGPNRFQGYLKDEEKTNEAIDKDGWLHTGDIGMWLPNGTLKIIDRKKNLFKLSQGEYISPEKVENVYSRSSFVAQVLVEGNSLKDFLVAMIVPDEAYLKSYCEKNNISGSFQDLCKNKQVNTIILNDLTKYGKEAGLMSYEQAKAIHLHSEQMSLQNGLATPTLKIKRNEARKYFKDVIDNLYATTVVKSS